MLGEATLDVSGTFAGEAICLLILFAAPQPYQCEADLAWARTEASSHARLQAVER